MTELDWSKRKTMMTNSTQPIRNTNRIDRRTVLQALGGAGITGLAGCLGSDDGNDVDGGEGDGDENGDDGNEGGDVADDASNDGADDASDDASETDDDSEGDSGNEDGTDSDGEDGDDGTAEITFLGETYTSSGWRVQCYDEGSTLAATFETEFRVDLAVSFYDDYVSISVINATNFHTADDYDLEEDNEWYEADVGHDEIEFDIEGDPSHASGAVHLEPDDEQAEDAHPDGVEVEFEIQIQC